MNKRHSKNNIRRTIPDFFRESPKEGISTSMTTTKSIKRIVFRPNNYRRQIEVKQKTNSGMKKIKTTIPKTSINSHTRILSIKKYMPNITIQYGKKYLTAIYSQNIIGGHKEHYVYEGTIKYISQRISQKKEEIRKKIDKAIKTFSRQFGLVLPFKRPKWSRYEDFIKGEEFIDKIPSEVIIHDTYFKKVYGEGIEFKSSEKYQEPTVLLKNYIKNAAIKDLAPEIANEINITRQSIEQLVPSINKLNESIQLEIVNKKLHLGVLKNIEGAFKKFNNRLSQRKLKDYW